MPTTRVDWGGIVQVVFVLAVTAGLYGLYRNQQTQTNEWKEVQIWLKLQKLVQFESFFKDAGKCVLECPINVVDPMISSLRFTG